MRKPVLLLLLLAMLYSCGKKKHENADVINHVVFPVNEIIRQSRDQNQFVLGAPQKVVNDKQYDNATVDVYNKSGYQLIITYSPATNMPTEAFLTREDDYYPDSLKRYLVVGNLSYDDSALYQIVSYKSMNDLMLYRGISVFPQE